MPGRSNSTTNCSPSCHASIGITAGCEAVPNSCRVRRSRSRKGSVRINIFGHLQEKSLEPFTDYHHRIHRTSTVDAVDLVYHQTHIGSRACPQISKFL